MATYEKQRALPVFDIPLSAWDERDRSNGITYQGRDYGRLLNAINNKQIPYAYDNQFFLNKEIAQSWLDQFNPATPTPAVAVKPIIDTAELRSALEQLLLAIGTN
jgi:hypothetical protein